MISIFFGVMEVGVPDWPELSHQYLEFPFFLRPIIKSSSSSSSRACEKVPHKK